MSAPALSSWHAQRSAGDGGTRVFNRDWRAKGDAASDQAKRPWCMEPDDYVEWVTFNTGAGRQHAASPCHDCLLDYAIEMRAIGKCNGTPGAAADVEDDEPEEPAARRTMVNLRVTVTAPCGTCLHEPICNRRESITALAQGDIAVEHSPLRGGLTLALSATVDCDAYLKVRKSPAASPAATAPAGDGRSKPRTPAQMAVIDKMREAKAAKHPQLETVESVD